MFGGNEKNEINIALGFSRIINLLKKYKYMLTHKYISRLIDVRFPYIRLVFFCSYAHISINL
ncbi:hypothetical protein PFAG_00602 [Plasmodium falciparum Santa Lucia]|uniref:Uncharacterized protein n=5 Tax=Plasmodium falciparum TaxID=5833 RepID=A0A024XDD2_PLAFC|nr:hypothetical protein PFNF135_00718 [Plasmodium falciparum NF135/5.C10]ETW63454.1 hypothetical protein PFMC_00672 [Plasmodium falciparum CAMP/Malaysia]EUR79056.1 hypothetical protein PFBG_00546 [Plasmodium falciparum 7G8]EUT91616.1 hypothetical protein PFAG_00602 [Plasmodium falciparum Santa Lucia]